MSRLSALSGEYVDAGLEARFRKERFLETARQARILLVLSASLNTLFLASDWRFYGDSHFWVAIPARLGVVLASLACLCLIEIVRTPRAAERVLVAWQAIAACCVGLLVTSHSEVAFFVVIMLPAIFYLAVPTGFAATCTMGIACSAAMLAGFTLPEPPDGTLPGLILAMVTMNAALTLVVSKTNRLRRLEWSATQAQMRANAELEASRKLLETIFMAVPIPLVVTEHDSGRLLRANEAAVNYFGGLETVRATQTIRSIYADPTQRDDLLRQIDETGRIENFEITVAMPDGGRRDMLLAGARLELEGKDCVITGGVDISLRKAMEARLEELAKRDSLTGALNRNAFFSLAEAEIQHARPAGAPVGVLMIDLDYFKLINDAFGHAAGDLALKSFTALCREHLRGQDFLGRLGGEEFACVLPGANKAEASAIAERLRNAAEDLKVEGAPSSLRLTVSIGVAEILSDEDDVTLALARADLALYGAKMRGRNKVVLADQEICSLSSGPQTRSIA